jgi:hypothetical protein
MADMMFYAAPLRQTRGGVANTVENVEVGTTASRGENGAGHSAIWLEHGADNLVQK